MKVTRLKPSANRQSAISPPTSCSRPTSSTKLGELIDDLVSRVCADRRSAARCGRMCALQSGMFPSRDQPDGLDELVPGLALSRQHTLTCRRQPIEAPPALARLLDPRPLDPAALLEAIRAADTASRGETPTARQTASRSTCRARSRGGVSPPARTAGAVRRPPSSVRGRAPERSMSVIGRYYTSDETTSANGCFGTERVDASGRCDGTGRFHALVATLPVTIAAYSSGSNGIRTRLRAACARRHHNALRIDHFHNRPARWLHRGHRPASPRGGALL